MYGYAKIETSQLSTNTRFMACDWEALLKKRKKMQSIYLLD